MESPGDMFSDGLPPDGPPPDPDDWTDDQWIEWLKRTDVADPGDATRPVTALGRVTHSTGGSMLGQAMLGMANAMFGREDDEVVIVAEGSPQPDEDRPFTVHLDPEHPERSVVVFRSRRPARRTRGRTSEGLV